MRAVSGTDPGLPVEGEHLRLHGSPGKGYGRGAVPGSGPEPGRGRYPVMPTQPRSKTPVCSRTRQGAAQAGGIRRPNDRPSGRAATCRVTLRAACRGLHRLGARAPEVAAPSDDPDRTGEQSFPASDPPSTWTGAEPGAGERLDASPPPRSMGYRGAIVIEIEREAHRARQAWTRLDASSRTSGACRCGSRSASRPSCSRGAGIGRRQRIAGRWGGRSVPRSIRS